MSEKINQDGAGWFSGWGKKEVPPTQEEIEKKQYETFQEQRIKYKKKKDELQAKKTSDFLKHEEAHKQFEEQMRLDTQKKEDQKFNQQLIEDKIEENQQNTLQSDTKYSIVVSHQTRIQCIINHIKYILGIDTSEDKTRFKNGAFFEIIIDPEFFSFNLIYEGRLSEKTKQPSLDRPYYSTNPKNEGLVAFKPIITDKPDQLKLLYGITGLNIENSEYLKKRNHFILVRHGDAMHNSDWFTKNTHLTRDTPLTKEGTEQALRAGELINYFISTKRKMAKEDIKKMQIQYLFASDLLRSRQTLAFILSKINPRYIYQPNNILIVPCLHELNITKLPPDGKCDSKDAVIMNYSLNVKGYEQFPSSKNMTEYNKWQNNVFEEYTNDWKFYYQFYGGKYRGGWYGPQKRQKCRETNPFKNMYDMMQYIDEEDIFIDYKKDNMRLSTTSDFGGGKSRRRRHNKRKTLKKHKHVTHKNKKKRVSKRSKRTVL